MLQPTKREMAVWALVLVAIVFGFWGQVWCLKEPAVSPGPNSDSTILSLTEEERAWLGQHPVIRVVQDPGWPPIEFADAQGLPSGMTRDYLKLIEQRLGVTFEQVRTQSWQEAYARLKRWEIDLTTSVTVTPERLTFWAFTRPYMKIPIVILTSMEVPYIAEMGELAGKKVAVVDGYAVTDWIPRDFPEISLVKVKNTQEGLDLLEKGTVFAFIDNMLVINYTLSKQNSVNIKIAGTTPYVNAQSMAIRKDWPILAGILQKALDSISERERAAIYRKWVPIRYEQGFNYRLFWQLLVLFLVIISGLTLWIRKLSREIRTRKETEAALSRSEERFRAIASNTPDHIIMQDSRLRYGFVVNPQLGLTEQDMIGKTDYDFLSKEEADKLTKVKKQVLESGKPVHFETSLISMAGRAEIFNGTYVPSFDLQGKVIGLIGYFRNITDRKWAEEALKENEKKYRLIVENSRDLIYTLSPEGKFLFMSPAVAHLLGYEAADLIGRPFQVLIHPEDVAACEENIRIDIEEGIRKTGFRYRVRHASGEWRWHTSNGGPVRDGQGKLLYYQGVARDITDHLKLEEQYHQAQKMESIGRLAGGVAHDFNNLLTAIIGNAQLALEDLSRESPLYEFIQEIKGAGERAAALTRQLLAFSRKQVLQPEVINLNEVVSDIEKILRRLVGEDIEVKTILAPDLGQVEADVGQIEQVIMNLAVNARDAMPEGGQLTIETANAELDQEYAAVHVSVNPGPYVMLSVSDSGAGISPEIQTRIFDPFFTTKERGRGTGLGLATVYGIVKQCRGNIWVYSEEGQGTTFKIYLPRVDKAVEGEKNKGVKGEARGGSETILVVEDEESVRLLATRVLQGHGYRVLTALDGQEALESCLKAMTVPLTCC